MVDELSKPESTEGRPWGQPLKKAEGAPLNLGRMVLKQKTARKQGAPNRAQPSRSHPNRRLTTSSCCSRDPRPAPGPARTRRHLDLGGAPGPARTRYTLVVLVCIDDADALCAGGTVAWTPSTLGSACAGGMVRPRSRQLLARAWAAGAGPGDSPLTIDLDSTICETYGLSKEGASSATAHRRAYHPLLHRRGADVPSARGSGQHRPRRRPLPA